MSIQGQCFCCRIWQLLTLLHVWGAMAGSKYRDDIRRRLAAGQAPSAIAVELGVARSTVWRAGKSQGKRKGTAAAYGVVGTRLSAREGAVLERLVKSGVGTSKGAVLRKLVRCAGGFAVPGPQDAAFLDEAERHLSRLGGNFNQIAGALSVSMRKLGRAEPTAAQVAAMHDAADAVVEIRHVIQQMLRAGQVRAEVLLASLGDDMVDAPEEGEEGSPEQEGDSPGQAAVASENDPHD